LYSVSFVTGLIVVIYQAARAGLLRGLIDEGALGEANGLLQSTNQGVRLLAPLTGAALFTAFGGPVVAALDAATFVVSAVLLAMIRGRDLDRRTDPVRWWPEMREGLLHIVRSADLRRLTIGTAVVMLLFGCGEVMIYALLEDGLERPTSFLGVLSTLQGVGSIVGGLLAGWVLAKAGELRTVALACAGAGAGLIVFGTGRLPLVVAACLAFGVVVSLYVVGYETLVQRRTTLQLQGRVMAGAEAAISFPYVISIALGALLVTVVPFRVVYTVGGIGAICTAIYLGRRMPEPAEPVSAAATDP
jgi:hypothetical protein